MKKVIKIVVVLAVLGGAGYGIWAWQSAKAKEATVVHYRTAPVVKMDIVQTVEATGTVEPIKEVEVGAQVNGKIIKLFVDYNSVVTNGQVVALIDPQVYEANYKSALAELHINEANIKKIKAQLVLAEKTLERKAKLAKSEMAPVADYDAALEVRDIAKANLESAYASVEKSKASVRQAKANLDYCTIISPVDGVVIQRSVDEGQTVVSSMNAVPLLKIAENLKVIQVEATVPEADVGSIRVGQSVSFTADAYRRKFLGKVKQIRLAATTENNVVTYPIIIEAENPDEMLFPGMTANIAIELARSENAVAVTSAAFRFRPKDVVSDIKGRKVWVKNDKGELEAIKVETGIADSSFTEIKAPVELLGREVLLGYERKGAKAQGSNETSNPFMPKMPKRNTNRGTAPAPRK